MLPSSAWRLQLTKERQHLTVRKTVRWCRAIQFQHFPKENVISKNAQISIPTTRMFRKCPRVRQMCPQMEKLFFLETWKMNWGSAKATNHCGTFTCRTLVPSCTDAKVTLGKAMRFRELGNCLMVLSSRAFSFRMGITCPQLM